MTYTGEVVVGLFYIAQCMRAWGAGTICSRVNERVVRRNDGIPKTVERKYVNVCWKLRPSNRRVNRRERIVVFFPYSGMQQSSRLVQTTRNQPDLPSHEWLASNRHPHFDKALPVKLVLVQAHDVWSCLSSYPRGRAADGRTVRFLHFQNLTCATRRSNVEKPYLHPISSGDIHKSRYSFCVFVLVLTEPL